MVQEDFTTKFIVFWQRREQWIVVGALTAILAAGAFLRFYHLGQAGVNEYYAAAVKSMLLSWHNFFFVAFEPGGSVSVDKPPLGFWIETLSAYLFGFSGFALALPNALAGVLSIFVLYKLVRQPFGPWAGLASAAILAMMPVAIATERNNTIDGMLVFVLLLAAWAFLQSIYTGKARWLFLGVLLVGLGFNIKMLQAFLPLPALYALYFFGGTKGQWLKKVLYLSTATVLLLAVSFSWAMAVDLTPAANRPYVDSSSNNSVMELIFGWNGLSRLTMSGGHGGMPFGSQRFGVSNGLNMSGGIPPGLPPGQGIQMLANNTSMLRSPPGFFGQPGPLRLFTWPLVGEASWLLPFVLGGLVVLAIVLWKRPFGEPYASFILWGGWLLVAILFFSFSQGLIHNYYLIMIGGPIAALTGMTLWALWQIIQRRWFVGMALAILLMGGTLAFETITLLGNTSLDTLTIEIAGILLSGGVLVAIRANWKPRSSSAALGLLLAAMLAMPVVWSGLTTFNNSPSSLPSAGPNMAGNHNMSPGMMAGLQNQSFQMPPGGAGNALPGGGVNQNLLNYLLNNTQPGTYLFATSGAMSAAGYILATARPVLALGGFTEQNDEVPLDKFVSLVKSGQLRFVLISDNPNWHKAIAQWVKENCMVVNASVYGGSNGTANTSFMGPMPKSVLYQCGCGD
jgi:4-amino-4-deoxy-L-arabinose transferase-like glycosyltransferase